MNARIKKKRDKKIIQICKRIKSELYKGYTNSWNSEFDIYKSPLNSKGKLKNKYQEAYTIEECYDEISMNRNLLKIVRKCYKDKFDIEEYSLSEIPYSDANGIIYYFINISDYDRYHNQGDTTAKIREIGFWVEYSKFHAIPFSLDGSYMVEHACCNEAVFTLD